MIKIRRNSFETNSSSMHSLVITSEQMANELREEEGNIYFSHDEMLDSLRRVDENGTYKSWEDDWYFGRAPFRILYNFEDKFQYAYANFVGSSNKENSKLNELMEVFYKLLPEVKTIKVPEYAGVDDYMLEGWLDKNNISIEEFLTNSRYSIIQDGDEYCIWEDLCDSGLIDLNSLTQFR